MDDTRPEKPCVGSLVVHRLIYRVIMLLLISTEYHFDMDGNYAELRSTNYGDICSIMYISSFGCLLSLVCAILLILCGYNYPK